MRRLPPRGRTGEAGLTLLELLVTGTLFMVFLMQIGSLWTSFDRHIGYMAARAELLHEGRTARAVLLSDLAGANSVTLGVSETLTLGYPGFGSPIITYTNNAGTLLRTDMTASWAMAAARRLQTAAYTLRADGSLLASLSFAKGGAQVTLNVFMNLPAQ